MPLCIDVTNDFIMTLLGFIFDLRIISKPLLVLLHRSIQLEHLAAVSLAWRWPKFSSSRG